jgi:ribosomal protein S18 acetylase RimI-like enzyme
VVKVLVRDVHEGDAESLAQLILEFTHVKTTPAQVRQRLSRSRGIEHPILAEVEGKVAGFASLRLLNYLGEDAPYAELSELFVTECYRGRGVGRALIRELEGRARAAGASSLAVLTAAGNEAAVALYQAMGFQEFSIGLQKWFSEERPYR